MSTRLTVKELAYELKHAAGYVYAMRARGFVMPGGTATLSDALKWLEENGNPFCANRNQRKLRKTIKCRQ